METTTTRSFSPEPAAASATIRSALAAAELFSGWPADAIEQLVPNARLRKYERGTRVVTGEGPTRQALLVVSGFLEVGQTTTGGRRFLLGIIGAGHSTGMVRLFEDAPADYGYLVRERAVVIHIQCDDMLAALDKAPALWPGVANAMLRRHVAAVNALLDQVVVGTAEQRVAATLQRLALRFGIEQPGGAGTRLRLRLSQEDLADMLCVSRQTINKELKRLEDGGVISSAYNTVVIVDAAALEKIVGAIRT